MEIAGQQGQQTPTQAQPTAAPVMAAQAPFPPFPPQPAGGQEHDDLPF